MWLRTSQLHPKALPAFDDLVPSPPVVAFPRPSGGAGGWTPLGGGDNAGT